MTLSAVAPWRQSPPDMSSSPVESVTEESGGIHRGRCGDCSAHHDALDVAAAWMWLETHLCGVETIHLH